MHTHTDGNNGGLRTRRFAQALLIFALRMGLLGIVTYVSIDILGAMIQWWPENAMTGWILRMVAEGAMILMVAGTNFLMMFGTTEDTARLMTALLVMVLCLGGFVYITFGRFKKQTWGDVVVSTLSTGAAFTIVLLFVWMFGIGANHPGLWVGALFVSIAVTASIAVWRTNHKQ